MARGHAFNLILALATAVLAGPAAARPRPSAPSDFPNIGYATWTDREPDYRFYPGDEIDVSVPSAPELDHSVQVAPDGRITLPLIPPVMVADRTVAEVERALDRAYSSQLLDAEVSVSVKQAQPLKVFVGGEVEKPGVYDFTGDMDALGAIIEAGGFKTSAKESQVVIIRRGPGGRAMMRTVNLKRALKDPARADLAPLRRFDIVYVPRSAIAEAGVFVQQYFRDLTPGVGFGYSVGGQGYVTAQ
ncbi:MAG: polysaccharide biosynthesis/export family protein [Caulobacteraceae bacterium]